MAEQIEIRAARADDSAGLADAWREFGRHYAELDADDFRVPDDEGLAEWFESRLVEDEGDDARWLVAERAGRIVGFVQAQIWRPAHDAERQLLREAAEPILKIDSLMVLKDERGAGVATTLMRAVEGWGIERGATHSVVIASLSGSEAVGFYENRMAYERKTIGFSKRLPG